MLERSDKYGCARSRRDLVDRMRAAERFGEADTISVEGEGDHYAR
jgi:hypothetical protein